MLRNKRVIAMNRAGRIVYGELIKKWKKGAKRLQHVSFAYGLPLHYSVTLLAG